MKNDAQANQSALIRQWWRALQGTERSSQAESEKLHKPFWFDRGPRAHLRRSTCLDAVAQESAVWRLVEKLQLPHSEHQAMLLVAGVLAHVKEDANDRKSLAYLLGVGPAANDEKPRLSELRFQRLMRADQADDFFQQLRRALSIAGVRADVAVLAEDLLAWSMERRFVKSRGGGMKFRWARDYYLKQAEQVLLSDAPTAP